MPDDQRAKAPDNQLQLLDVYLVDVMSHIEALLRHTHSIQRALLQLRQEAPPPEPSGGVRTLTVLRSHAESLRRECLQLTQISEDLADGVEKLGDKV